MGFKGDNYSRGAIEKKDTFLHGSQVIHSPQNGPIHIQDSCFLRPLLLRLLIIFYFSVPIIGGFGGVCLPIIRARMSKLVVEDEQGWRNLLVVITKSRFRILLSRSFSPFLKVWFDWQSSRSP